jgi:hypothetical protein
MGAADKSARWAISLDAPMPRQACVSIGNDVNLVILSES